MIITSQIPLETPKNYRIEKTGDGSATLYSKTIREACHSYAGARGETQHNFIEGCQILAKAGICAREKRPLRILEIGLGVGHGVMGTFEALKKWCLENERILEVDFVTTECDPQLLAWTPEFWGERWPGAKCEQSPLDFKLSLLKGDARRMLPQFLKRFPDRKADAIYQDPFSPRSNPELWSVEWFSLLKKLGHFQTILATYSSASAVRLNLLSAGWRVEKRPGFASKRESLQAFC